MNINNVILFLLLSIIIVDDIWLKFVDIMVMVIFLVKRKLVSQNKRELIINIFYLACVIFLNYILSIDLSLLNFIYFTLVNFVLFFLKKDIKIEKYFSVYFLLTLMIGGYKLLKVF